MIAPERATCRSRLATISAMPLGLTLLCAYAAARFGAWAARSSAVEDLRTLLLGSFVMAGVHGLVALVVAVLAAFLALMYGGVFGLSVVTTDRWGGLPLTIMLASLSIVLAFHL